MSNLSCSRPGLISKMPFVHPFQFLNVSLNRLALNGQVPGLIPSQCFVSRDLATQDPSLP